ncbi:Lar family restriction alleviation protein [Serratia marcescens]
MTMHELKPCPFCGGEPEHYPDGAEEGFVLMCFGEGCFMNTFGYATAEEAETAWNRRAVMPAAAPEGALKC